MNNYFTAFLLIFFMLGCEHPDSVHIIGARVLDKNFNIVKTIDDPESIARLNAMWRSRKEVDGRQLPPEDFVYSLDIISTQGGRRCLINTNGYIMRLGYTGKPTYFFEDKKTMHSLLISDFDSRKQKSPNQTNEGTP